MPVPQTPMSSSDHSTILESAKSQLSSLFDSVGMPESHGLAHCCTVLDHMEAAVAGSDLPTTPTRVLTLKLAALLHEADDRKYFKDSNNAEKILRSVLTSEEEEERQKIIDEVVEMISYVSASSNGNSVPEKAKTDPQLLWPRFCDRLEAIGMTGAVRCWQYNREANAPLSCPTTPRPQTEAEVWSHVKPELFQQYQASGGGSASMMDHYYDKLLQVAVFQEEVVMNKYLLEEARTRVEPLVRICLEFGRTGEVPEHLIKQHVKC